VQKLTMAAAVDSNNRELPKKFFATDFTIRTGHSGSFCSQLCASACGIREFSLPSGEDQRLRFVLPFSKASRDFLPDKKIPFYLAFVTMTNQLASSDQSVDVPNLRCRKRCRICIY
jgi:hypothetical protein